MNKEPKITHNYTTIELALLLTITSIIMLFVGGFAYHMMWGKPTKLYVQPIEFPDDVKQKIEVPDSIRLKILKRKVKEQNRQMLDAAYLEALEALTGVGLSPLEKDSIQRAIDDSLGITIIDDTLQFPIHMQPSIFNKE